MLTKVHEKHDHLEATHQDIDGPKLNALTSRVLKLKARKANQSQHGQHPDAQRHVLHTIPANRSSACNAPRMVRGEHGEYDENGDLQEELLEAWRKLFGVRKPGADSGRTDIGPNPVGWLRWKRYVAHRS